MNILVVLRNLYNNPDPFDEESLICDSDINLLTEAADLRDSIKASEGYAAGSGECTLTALLISETKSDSEKVLRKAASYGADRILHAPLDDFDFSDANRFSRVIAGLIKDIDPLPSIVMFGRLAYDGDSVNIATQTAENLNWHRAIYSSEVVEIKESNEIPRDIALDMASLPLMLSYKKSLDNGGLATVEVPLPAVIHTVRKRGLRGQAKIADIMRAYGEIDVETFDGNRVNELALEAVSGPILPTPIQEIPPYRETTNMTVLNGISDVDTAANIIATLKSLGFQPK